VDHLTGMQISEWEAYDKLDPIGTWRDDFRMAKIESLLVNIANALYHKQGDEPKVTTPMDFMVKWGEEVEETEPIKQSAEDMLKVFAEIAGAQKGKKDFPLKSKKKLTN
jgi:hypothetical protein